MGIPVSCRSLATPTLLGIPRPIPASVFYKFVIGELYRANRRRGKALGNGGAGFRLAQIALFAATENLAKQNTDKRLTGE